MSDDICLLLINNTFYNNTAILFGGAIYIELTDTSCIHLLDNYFAYNSISTLSGGNGGNALYLNSINGDYGLLKNQQFLSRICDGNCSDFSSSLTYLCADLSLTEATANCQHNTSFNLFANLATEQIIYIYGYDAFGNTINHFNVFSPLLYDAIIYGFDTSPDALWLNENVKMVPIVITTVPGSNKRSGIIEIYDQNQIANTISINFTIGNCASNQYKKIIDATTHSFACIDCPSGSYTINNNECQNCAELEGIQCNYGTAKVKPGWYAGIINGTYIVTGKCAPGYCCRKKEGCYLDEPDTLCALNRNPSSILCARCNGGYFPTLSSIGDCKKCEGVEWGIICGFIIGGFIFICLLSRIFLNAREEEVPHPLHTYIVNTLFFFYSVFPFVVLEHFLPESHWMIDIITLTFGACLGSDFDGEYTFLADCIVPAILAFDVLLFWCFSRIYYEYKQLKGHQRIFKGIMYVFKIICVQLAYIVSKYFTLTSYNDEDYNLYYSYIDDVWSLFVVGIFPLTIPVALLCAAGYVGGGMKSAQKNAIRGKTISVSNNCCCCSGSRIHIGWFIFGSVDVGRLFFCIILSLRPSPHSFIIFCMILVLIYAAWKPYKQMLNNYGETFILC